MRRGPKRIGPISVFDGRHERGGASYCVLWVVGGVGEAGGGGDRDDGLAEILQTATNVITARVINPTSNPDVPSWCIGAGHFDTVRVRRGSKWSSHTW